MLLGLHLLRTACEAFQRMRACQASIAEHGEAVADKWGQLKPHPLLAAERDSRAAMMAALKSLNLDLEPLKAVGRPGSGLGVISANG
jgi:phage terminase small subunit